ncbi:phosphatidylglycerol lysyltransferase domain-containing protein [Variovorax dokdonensis]|uniref:Phosphatidylglycerol lysyltransferase domain-containing protein n=1 Tax=Variovorax dokdonensis TaxID=344883 RepID=A0ABT7NEH3_9BURK|nr:phosphatidylglycerol lysyltransferase domain-containing protein [Variovorax dokdonensis]MDM0046349.1 phosphatidylglycerol lysyltransferase domain-containing protein [Variovorax dokdonensis]
MPLSLDMQAPIEAALAILRDGSGEHCLSDHAFSNLYLFRAAHDYRYLPGPWPCITGRTYDGMRHLMPLFALSDAPIDLLCSLMEAHDALYPLARRDADALPSSLFALAESADDADYLYAASQFLEYSGRVMSDKRGQVRDLQGAHVLSAQAFDEDGLGAARQVLEGWMSQKSKVAGEADESACIEALENAGRFGLEGFVHFADGLPVGFVLAQELQPRVFVMRFAKGLDSHVGIYPHMFQHFCRSFARPVDWLNFEQDMGLPGFRRSKRSYGPAALIPKFRASLRR